MIANKKELRFYIMADRMMNRGYFKLPLSKRLLRMLYPDHVMNYLEHMRKFSYYENHRSGIVGKWRYFWHKSRYYQLGLKCGFSIGKDCFGYGLTLLHYGSIVVGQRNRIGNYAIVFPASCIVDDGSVIGDGLFMATGAVISKQLVLGDAVNVAANSVLAQSCPEGYVTFAGAPAKQVKENPQPWYAGIWGHDPIWQERVSRVESLRKTMSL